MSEPERFLTRWSRRKLGTEEQVEPAPEADAAQEQTAADGESKEVPASTRAKEVVNRNTPEFDLRTLPPLDSIGAQSDISAFLKPGVPGALRLAALRRAWSTDPAIRDFKGLQKNDWNFNDPNGVLGFGELDPSFDVGKMLTDLFGETRRTHEPRPEGSKAVEQPRFVSTRFKRTSRARCAESSRAICVRLSNFRVTPG
jgi:hypothetical protein